ncbi:MAG: acetyl-CoA carboxylase biotin carboxylase subunit [Anaerolineae bacterium]|nr:acetyl-CoA carboxylase biotin carboxylase subunit [Anaerolineae bacterium]
MALSKQTQQTRLINKILIANRGEIAVRIIRACRELGIRSVAVFSDADRAALHVRYADEAYHIGPSSPRESYLVIDKIIDAARKAGADAIHPGYGFLSEREAFAQACADAGIVFIGPTPEAISTMGDKQQARETVMKAGVPVVPGTEPGLRDDDIINAANNVIKYPLMVKAAAGGGGKGMRIVRHPSELASALAAAHREAANAFGDGTVYLERLVEGARHIEFQILADMYGNTIYLGERECSIQRRHQKLVEESPSPFMDDELRLAMGTMAVKAAQSVGYVNAGTIECLVDKNRNFYFLEMNTRIQVEHPVTELVTGVDLVKEQIRIARGRKLGITQEEVQINGHAIECRINAEDPYNNFLPSVGTIGLHLAPTGPGVRLDSGIYAGYEVTPYYDSMLAKLIVWGSDRATAIRRLSRALEEYRITGLKTNLPFHMKLVDSHHFISGKFDTGFVENYFNPQIDESRLNPEAAAIVATLIAHYRQQQAAQIISPNQRDTSNWKWVGRYERIHR